MGTDYNLPGYAARFMASRSLSTAASRRWVEEFISCCPAKVLRILDLGCGPGRFLPLLSAAFPSASIVAVDLSEPMLRASRSFNGRSWPVVANASILPLRAGSIDFCFCSMMLQYVNDMHLMLAELYRATALGARVFIRQGTQESVHSFEFLKYFPTALELELARMPHASEIRFSLREAGFSIIAEKQVALPAAQNTARLFSRVAARGFPSLQLVPDREFRRGLQLLSRHLSQLGASGEGMSNEVTPVFVAEARVS